jgi:hypothetical protein
MGEVVEKTSFLGHRRITYYEDTDDNTGTYSYINGDWVWLRDVEN